MKIFVHNRQTRRRPNARKLVALARFFMLQAGRLKSECPWAEVSVVLLNGLDHRPGQLVAQGQIDALLDVGNDDQRAHAGR